VFDAFWKVPQLFAHRASGKTATVPLYKDLVRPGRESSCKPTSTEADALTTKARAGVLASNNQRPRM